MTQFRAFALRLVLLLSAFAVLALPAHAEDNDADPDAAIEFKASEGRTDKLDQLFANLKRERDPAKARRISNRIWAAWSSWDDDAIDLLMRRARQAMELKRMPMALDILDQVVTLVPDYSEAWNLRATVHYMGGNYELSIADVERTLALEPRHYGALTGLAQMMQALDEDEKAIVALQRALNVYPAMEGPKQALIRLLEETQGEEL